MAESNKWGGRRVIVLAAGALLIVIAVFVGQFLLGLFVTAPVVDAQVRIDMFDENISNVVTFSGPNAAEQAPPSSYDFYLNDKLVGTNQLVLRLDDVRQHGFDVSMTDPAVLEKVRDLVERDTSPDPGSPQIEALREFIRVDLQIPGDFEDADFDASSNVDFLNLDPKERDDHPVRAFGVIAVEWTRPGELFDNFLVVLTQKDDDYYAGLLRLRTKPMHEVSGWSMTSNDERIEQGIRRQTDICFILRPKVHSVSGNTGAEIAWWIDQFPAGEDLKASP